MDNKIKSSSHKSGALFRKWSRLTHRYLSFFFASVLLIYVLSGIFMNHLGSLNPHYTVERINLSMGTADFEQKLDKAKLLKVLEKHNVEDQYTKHFYPSEREMKVFFKGGSNMIVDTSTGEAVYDKLSKRIVISEMTYLHYNPSKMWTLFSDIFCVSMIIVIVTGYTMMRGKEGFVGKGGIITLIGLLVPLGILFL